MLPFPCRSEVILAPFLSSPQWDAPVSLMQAEMLPDTAVGREGLLVGAPQPQLRFILRLQEPSGAGSAQQGQPQGSVCPQQGGRDRASVTSLGARGEWPEQGESPEGTAALTLGRDFLLYPHSSSPVN